MCSSMYGEGSLYLEKVMFLVSSLWWCYVRVTKKPYLSWNLLMHLQRISTFCFCVSFEMVYLHPMSIEWFLQMLMILEIVLQALCAQAICRR